MGDVVSPSLSGDFNGDGSVDAADYVVWRKNGESQREYDEWAANFGATSRSNASAQVPEASSLILLGMAGVLFCGRCNYKKNL